MNDNAFSRLRDDINWNDGSAALERLITASNAPLDYLGYAQNWPPPGVELTPESAVAEVHRWAASAFGTLELLYVEMDPAVAELLRELVRAENLEESYGPFHDARQ